MIDLGFLVCNVDQAWFMAESGEDQRLPLHCNPKEFVSLDHLAGPLKRKRKRKNKCRQRTRINIRFGQTKMRLAIKGKWRIS